MKQFTLFGAALLAVITGIIWAANRPAGTPQKTVTQMLKAVQKGDFESVEVYTLQGLGINYAGKNTRKLLTALGTTLQYQISDTVIDGDCAQVEVTITVVDISGMLGDLSFSLLRDSLSGTASAEKPFYQALIEQINQQSQNTITNTILIQLVQNEEWVVDIQQSSGLISAMTGGLYW